MVINRIVGEKRYQVTKQFEEECKSNVGQYEKTGKVHVVEDNLDITASDNLVDFKIEDNCYVNDTFVGTTVAKKITVNILNPNNEINLENKEISVQVGMIINQKEENIPFGNFIIEKPKSEELKEKTSFTGYDYMIKFNTEYKNRVTYPIPAGELFEDVCEQVGLEAGNTNFVNSDYMILGNPFTNNEDCRTVLSNIAQLAGGFARIGRDNKPYIISLKNVSNLLKVKDVNAMTVKELNLTIVKMLSGGRDNADVILDGNNYLEDFTKNEQWGEINSLILSISGEQGENTVLQDDDSIAKNGLTELTIEDNYFLINQAEREKVITPLWNSLKGLKYLPFKVEYYGYPYLDTGDMIYIQDTKDIGYISYVFNHTFTFNGAYSGTLETEAMTKTQTAYKNTTNNKKKFRQVERKIDKINGEIEDIIEEQTDFSNKISRTIQDINGITDEIKSFYDFEKEVSGTNELLLEDALNMDIIRFETKAKSVQGMYPRSTLYPSKNLYPKMGGTTITIVFGRTSRLVTPAPILPSSTLYPSSDLYPRSNGYYKQEFEFHVNEPLRNYAGVNDRFVIELNKEEGVCVAKVLRYIDLSDDGIYTIYDEPKEEIVKETHLPLFEGDNYVYIKEFTDWEMNATYVFNNELNKEYALRVETNSKIRRTADEINLEVSKKVNQDEVIASINLSPEQIKILAKNLQLEGFTSINGNFTIDEEGNMTCNDAKINGAVIANGEKFSVDEEGNVVCKSATMENVTCENFTIKNSTIQEGYIELKSTNGNSSFSVTDTSTDRLNSELSASLLNFNSNLSRNVAQIGVDGGSGNGFVSVSGVAECANLVQTSRQEKKKYIKKVDRKAIDLINNSDICQYQLKGEKATGHKHYGLVVGKDYNCASEVISENGKGVEIYSMVALAWKAIQELVDENKKLNKKLEEVISKGNNNE